jgi:sarcosine oxidase
VSAADVVVVGAGAMGSATAYWLARDGRKVVLLERFAQGHTRGSSHGQTRIFRLAYPDPAYVGLAQRALELWREIEAEAAVVLVEPTGSVDHGDEDSTGEVAQALGLRGAAFEMLPPEEAEERWPGMRFDDQVLFHPDGGRCLADRTVRTLQDRAAAHGAEVHFDVGPARLELDDGGDGVRVTAPSGEWRAGVAVVTAGPWVERVVAGTPAAEQIPPMLVTHEQIQHFAPVADLDRPELWPSFIHHRHPWHYGLLSPDEGMKVATHLCTAEFDPDKDPVWDVDRERSDVAYVERWFPGLEPRPVHKATCIYTNAPDEDFVFERAGPIVVGSTCSGHGFKFTPVVGRLLADLAEGRVERVSVREAGERSP